MSNESGKPWQGRQGEAQRIVEQVREQFPGQARSEKNLEQARDVLQKDAEANDLQEAAAFTEEIIKFLNYQWNAREFTVEQRLFSFTLTAVNLRQTLPAERGGPAKFDEINKAAIEYYQKNS